MRRLRESGLALAFLAPSLVVFGVFFFYPIVRIAYWGFYQQNRLGTDMRGVGWDQYRDLLLDLDSEFWDGLITTVLYAVYTVPAGIVLGLLLAVAAHRRLKGIKIYQTVFSSTVATSVAVASVIWVVLINPTVGRLPVDWLSNSSQGIGGALFGVAVSSIWQNLGLTFIIVLAGLQAVPDELMEAATVDGMSATRRFFTVTLPMLSPTLLFLVVVLTVFAFQAFAQIDILTSGGPAGSTETLVYKIFQLQAPSDLGTGSVMAIGLFVLTFVVALAQFLLLERRVHYAD